ncbi:MAG: hypothetical protein COA88_08000 [Kordia sp.]|nr:MAG: hypothetical protein COA88_08000 [Kordia sp.]
MKRNYIFFVFLVFLMLKTSAQSIQDIINQTSLANVTLYVNELSGEVSTVVGGNTVTITHRVSNNDNNLAADYIKEKLTGFGLTITDQVYTPGATGGRNIIATQTGVTNPNNIYIISAHYDSTHNHGADDNASGTAAIIELARILSKYCTENTIVYALWDQEETGLNGSAYYAQQATNNGDNILGAFNIDMMGYDGNDDKHFDIDVRPIANSIAMKDEIISVLNNAAYGIDLIVNVVNPGSPDSDHSSFWNQGYSAVLFGENWKTNDITTGYHSDNDRIGLFNMPYYHKMCKLVVGYIVTVASPIFIDKTITQNGTSLSSNETGSTYQWVDCNNSNTPVFGQTNQQFTPTVSGNYAVQITKNNCTKTSACISFNVLGISDYQLQNIALFPNPVKDNLTITGIQNNSSVLNVKLVSITGKEIFKKILTHSNSKINMQSLATGIYFLEITATDRTKKVFKVIKE